MYLNVFYYTVLNNYNIDTENCKISKDKSLNELK